MACRFVKTREKKLIFPKNIRDSLTFYGYQSYPLVALNEFRKMNHVIKKQLDKIICPLLIIHSNNDQVSIKDNVNIVMSLTKSKNKKVVEVQKAPHSIFDTNEDTEFIFDKVNQFIKELINNNQSIH